MSYEIINENNLWVIKAGKQYLTHEYTLSDFFFSAISFNTKKAAEDFLNNMPGSGSGNSGALSSRLGKNNEVFDRIGNKRTERDDVELLHDRDRSFQKGKEWREKQGKKTLW